MLEILIAAASRTELAALQIDADCCVLGENAHFSFLTDGGDCVGAVPTAVSIMRSATAQRFDFAINLGFCGARDKSLTIGESVVVSHDTFFDYGFVRPSGFVPLQATPFPMRHCDPDGWIVATAPCLLKCVHSPLRVRRGYTMAFPSQGEPISAFGRAFPSSSVETMEGAAFAFVTSELGIPALSIRTVSNYCAPGEAAQWSIQKAQKGVREAFIAALAIIRLYLGNKDEW